MHNFYCFGFRPDRQAFKMQETKPSEQHNIPNKIERLRVHSKVSPQLNITDKQRRYMPMPIP